MLQVVWSPAGANTQGGADQAKSPGRLRLPA